MEIINITCIEFNEEYGTSLRPDMRWDIADEMLEDILGYRNFLLDIDPDPPKDWAKEMHGEGIMSLDKITCYNITDLGMHVAVYDRF